MRSRSTRAAHDISLINRPAGSKFLRILIAALKGISPKPSAVKNAFLLTETMIHQQ
jgi:hypothetical protein